ncbi:hypothetical protein RHMOL_Rhmol11G0241100 [Rhododendron molle]|uniref:Uncharacterized protein n=1 Tax=Rhododendron molle TaxID=49168 RepID=A0ACC0LVN5_RHOML|nr:hypothetical protein RHMOL_Rhmol11G0241100 [Rhododendron molle]
MREQIGMAVERVMVGEDAEEMMNRAKEFKEMAKKAVEEGGSSHTNLNDLIHELSSYRVILGIELLIPIYHSSQVSEPKQLPGLSCLECLKMKHKNSYMKIDMQNGLA